MNARGFDVRYPLGTTHWDWQEIDGSFAPGPGYTANFDVLPEWRSKHSWLVRLGFRLSRRKLNVDVQVRGRPFGLTGEELSQILNDNLRQRLGTVNDPEHVPHATAALSDLMSESLDRTWRRRRRIQTVAAVLVLAILLLRLLLH